MSPLSMYQENLSNDEFLKTAFILMKRKVERILELKLGRTIRIAIFTREARKSFSSYAIFSFIRVFARL